MLRDLGLKQTAAKRANPLAEHFGRPMRTAAE
jgi:hypothetical protein